MFARESAIVTGVNEKYDIAILMTVLHWNLQESNILNELLSRLDKMASEMIIL